MLRKFFKFKIKNKKNSSLAQKSMVKGFTHTPKFGVTPKGGGFTLVETLVAVSIFTVSVLALLVILSSSIANVSYAKKKIIAGYLAQEGVEYMRNMRDTFVLYSSSSQNGWDAFITKTSLCDIIVDNTKSCYFDDANLFNGGIMPMVNLVSVTACGAACPVMLYDATAGGATEGRYNYSSGITTDYIRKIKITLISPDEIKVSSTVSWLQGSGVYSVTLSEDLFNWIEQ